MKLKKGDKIKIMAGKDKGRDGVIEKVFKKSGKVVVPSINLYKKHVKKSEQMPQGGVVEVPRPLDSSKVALICPHCKKPTRIGYELDKGKKYRICKRCKARI